MYGQKCEQNQEKVLLFCGWQNISESHLFIYDSHDFLLLWKKSLWAVVHLLTAAVLYFNGVFIKELETHARIFLSKYIWACVLEETTLEKQICFQRIQMNYM